MLPSIAYAAIDYDETIQGHLQIMTELSKDAFVLHYFGSNLKGYYFGYVIKGHSDLISLSCFVFTDARAPSITSSRISALRLTTFSWKNSKVELCSKLHRNSLNLTTDQKATD